MINTGNRKEPQRQRIGLHPAALLALGSVGGLLILLLELSVPQLVGGGIPYVVLILLSLWFPWRYAPAAMALIGTVFAMASYTFVVAEPTRDVPVSNLGLELLVLWITAYLIFRYQASERSLKGPEGRLRALVDTAVDGVIIIDSMGIVEDFNPACEKLFGYPAHEVIGRNVRMLMPAPYQEEHDGYLAQYRETGERRIIGIGREVEGRRKNGSTFPLELSVGEARHGDKQSFVGIIRDITARKAAEKALQAAREQAETANQAKSLFLANMSHEIRTPMNAVLGYTQIIESDSVVGRRHREALRAIDRAGNHLLGVINQILDLSKIEAGAMDLDIENFDLDELVESLSSIFKVRCEQKGLAWKVERRIDHGTVRGDQGKLRQVLINLLGNAVKFTDRGRVCLALSQSGNSYRFEVTDTGWGIRPAARMRIFEPFQQSDEGIAKGGTGLGLALSRRQIELMGGNLELACPTTGGSQFAFDIALPPAVGPISAASLQRERVTRLAPNYRVRALVVDDVPDNRALLAQMLETVGVDVSVAEHGAEAVEKTRLHGPDIVFMDVRMPVMDGTKALYHIKEQAGDKRVVCVAISAAGWSHETERYFEVGFDDFIAKPYRFETVCKCIEDHLDVRFERETNEPVVAGTRENAPDLSATTLPEPLRQRLLEAARINAFTEIEAVLAELKGVGARERELVEHLQGYLRQYDSRAIVDTVERLARSSGSDTKPEAST